jgi:hypothetical protein
LIATENALFLSPNAKQESPALEHKHSTANIRRYYLTITQKYHQQESKNQKLKLGKLKLENATCYKLYL